MAMGDMFYRMAARFALSLVMESAQRALRPHQFGVGVEDGCTQVVQSLQHLLSLPPAPAPPSPRPPHQFAFSRPRPAPAPADPTLRPLACLSIDVANAFNSVDRAAVLRAVYDSPELAQCWRMVAFGYGQPSPLLMPCGSEVADADAFVQSSNGVRQGDPLAALLFALAMHVVYKRVAEICSAGCFAYSDDSHGVGWLSECWRAWEELLALLAPLGLRLNARKCQVTCFHTAWPAARTGCRRPRGIPRGGCDNQYQRAQRAGLRGWVSATLPLRTSWRYGRSSVRTSRRRFGGCHC